MKNIISFKSISLSSYFSKRKIPAVVISWLSNVLKKTSGIDILKRILLWLQKEKLQGILRITFFREHLLVDQELTTGTHPESSQHYDLCRRLHVLLSDCRDFPSFTRQIWWDSSKRKISQFWYISPKLYPETSRIFLFRDKCGKIPY